MNISGYALATFYVKSIDKFGLLQQLEEDDYFGNFTFLIDGRRVSRDLLDSMTEIYFLDKHLNVSSRGGLNILDIGAGYGRLAHRMVEAFPNIQTYFCTDAIAISTFICEYYLRFRNSENRTQVIPLDDIESTLKNQSIDVAVNVHSFSECSISATEWWISLLEKHRIRYLMIVPNARDHGGELMQSTGDRQDIRKVVEEHGYKLVVKEPKFRDLVVATTFRQATASVCSPTHCHIPQEHLVYSIEPDMAGSFCWGVPGAGRREASGAIVACTPRLCTSQLSHGA